MTTDKLEKHEFTYLNEDKPATQKDLKILELELGQKISDTKNELELKISELKSYLEGKINSITVRLGSLIIACSGILFGLLSYFHR